jgi:pyruvate/2-oxoglutarate dehydrogenase complex dihydrolipoamide dehydrogenase (E3) component
MNAREALSPDLCILGASAAGSALAIAAAAQGLSVALIGKEPAMDRLASIVPGEAFRTVAEAAAQRPTQLLGAFRPRPVLDLAGFARAQAHLAGVADALAPKYAQARIEAMNVSVLKPPGRFIRPDAVETAAGVIKARRFVIAPALRSRPLSIRGLDLIQPLTAADLRRLERPPERLIIIGADPRGLETAQAMRRLGGEVALLSETRIFADEDDEIVAPLRLQFLREGVVLREEAKILRIEPDGAGLRILIAAPGAASEVEAFDGSHLFLASGAAPALEGLGLAAAGVRFDASGVKVDANLRSSNRRVYAIGAAAGGDAESEAYRVLRHMRRSPFGFFAGRSAPPRTRVAWTSPQIAFTGLTEDAARKRRRRICVSRFPYSCADRAQIDGPAAGHVKLVMTRRGKILGAAIVGPVAGELINLYTLSISRGMHASDFASTPVPYPSFAEAAQGATLAFEARRTAATWRIFRIARLIAQAIQ